MSYLFRLILTDFGMIPPPMFSCSRTSSGLGQIARKDVVIVERTSRRQCPLYPRATRMGALCQKQTSSWRSTGLALHSIAGIDRGVQIVPCELRMSLAPAIYPEQRKCLWSSALTLQTSNSSSPVSKAVKFWAKNGGDPQQTRRKNKRHQSHNEALPGSLAGYMSHPSR